MKQGVKNLIAEILKREFPFAVYRLPEGTEFYLVAQTNNSGFSYNDSNDFINEKGFLIAPFIHTDSFRPEFIRPDIFFSFKNFDEQVNIDLPESFSVTGKKNNYNEPAQTSADDFQHQVEETVEKIKSGQLKKSVLSAITIRNVAEDFESLQLFEKLSRQYPEVLVYLINTPQTGCWIGATPELLLKFDEKQIETVSLAGTQFDSGNNGKTIWGKKEIEEQQLVTDHIQQSFEQNFSEPIQISETKTISTGHLLHLRTDFKLVSQNGSLKKSVNSFLKYLHPTPAISGSPKEASMAHILQTEKHERAYYTGFLGPVGLNEASYLFVNLRCLKYENGKLIIYTGAGITADSVPENEWEEVQLKAQTILKVL